MASPPTSGIRVYLLGRFRVIVHGRAVEDAAWRRERAASLIKMLALASHHRVHREQLIEALWPESDASHGINALHQVIHVARQILRSPEIDAPHLVQLHHEVVSLAPVESIWVDTRAFTSAAVHARHTKDPLAMETALELYGGELLPDDRYEEWTTTKRDALQRVYLETLMHLARVQTEAQQYRKAISALRRVLETDPAHEDAHISLMHAYASSGQRSSALRQFRRLQTALWEDLGTTPSPIAQELHRRLASGDVPDDEFVGKQSAPRHGSSDSLPPLTSNLPLEVNSFIGRSHDVAEVSALLGTTRLLTLTGAGGCGKTRLAVRVASVRWQSDQIDVAFVDLSALTQASLVPQAIASTLDIAEQSGRSVLDTLIAHVQARRLIILLDNCEHVIDSCARVVLSLLEQCPHVRILCTSREALHIPGEVVWRVSSLSLPDLNARIPVDALLKYESVHLFRDRARAVEPTFDVTATNARAVIQICHRLDGIPLALELAAARTAVLSLEQIVERLDDCFALLSHGTRTALSRQQTMKALLDWSYDLLTEREKILFRILAVFAGFFDLRAVEAIGEPSDHFVEDGLDLVQGLVDKSLVTAATLNGEVRYRLLEPIRQYAALQLDAQGDTRSYASRHVDWYLGLATTADNALWSGEHQSTVSSLERDRENIRSALAWCVVHDKSRGLQLAQTQWQFWLLRGYLSEGRRWLEQLLDGPSGSLAVHARGWLNAWALATRQGSYGDTTAAYIDASVDIHRTLGDRTGLAQAVYQGGIQAYIRGRYEESRARFEESCELSTAVGFTPGRALALYALGIIAWAQGSYSRARTIMETALELFHTCDGADPVSTSFLNVPLFDAPFGQIERAITVQEETWVLLRRIEARVAIGYVLANLGNLARLQDASAEALVYLERSLAAFQLVGDSAGLSQALNQKGNFLRWTGRYDDAQACLEESLNVRRELGDRRGMGRSLNNLGMLALVEGEPARAREMFNESLSLFVEMGDRPGMTATFENLGHNALVSGEIQSALDAYIRSLELSYEMGGVTRSTACNLRHRGLAERTLGDISAARASFEASRELYVAMGDVVSVATLDTLLNSGSS